MYFPVDEELGFFVQHDTFLDKDLKPVSELFPQVIFLEPALVLGQDPSFLLH